MQHTIALVAPLSGAVADVGASALAAAKMALSDAGEPPMRLVVIDDACDPDRAVIAARSLTDDTGVIGVVGHYCTVAALAAAPVYAQGNLPLVVWGAHHVDITDKRAGPAIFRLCGTFRHEAMATVAMAWRRGWRRLAILHDASAYGHEHATMFTSLWTAAGGTAVMARRPDGSLIALDVDAVWIAAAPHAWWKAFRASEGIPPADRETTASLLLALWEAGCSLPVVATAAAIIDADTLRVSSATPAPGHVITLSEAHVCAKLLPDEGKFDLQYAALTNVPPLSPYARYAYAATKLVLDLLQEGASTRAKLANAIRHANGRPTIVGPVAFDDRGQQRQVPIGLFEAQDGIWKSCGLA